jgi:hypothetical protein
MMPQQQRVIAARAAAGLIAAIVFAFSTLPAEAQRRRSGPIQVTVNDVPISVEGQSPIEQEGRVLVPLRGVFEKLGATVRFDTGTGTITAVKNDKRVVIRLGDTIAEVNGEVIPLTAAPMVVNGVTMVPLRLVSESLGGRVFWDRANRTVRIATDSVVAARLPLAPGDGPVFGQVTGYYPEASALSIRVHGGENNRVMLGPTATLTVQGGPGPTTTLPLAELRRSLVGEQVRIERDGVGNGTKLLIVTNMKRGDLKSLVPLPNGGYKVTLTDGTVVDLRPGASITSTGRVLTGADVKAGERVVVTLNPATGVGQSLEVVTPMSPLYELY